VPLSTIELFSKSSGRSVEVLSNIQGVLNIEHSSGTVPLSDKTQVANFSRLINSEKVNGRCHSM